MKTINVGEIIDNQKFNRFHLQLLICCMFIIICDGYDMFMLGTIIPTLMDEWGISPIEAGALSSYALIGMMLGALIFGPVADKIGRKNVIFLCTIIFSVFTFTSGFANGFALFAVQRFIAGLGLGGVMPNLVALITEYAPKKLRSTLVAIMFSGHALGGVVASVGAIYLIPNFGWRMVVWLAAVPLLLLPLLNKVLPESINFYVLRNQKDTLISVLSQIDPNTNYSKTDKYILNAEKSTGFPVKKLFSEHRALSTIMFWISFFMCLLVMYGLSTWLPKIMQGAGYPLGSSLTFLLTLNIGAVIGAITGGKLADRFGSRKVLISYFLLAFVSLLLLSFKPSMFLLYVLLMIAGGTTTGTQIITNAYVSQYYPSEIRSTGIGWALGIGRIGGIMGPTLVGILLSQQFSLQVNFLAFAIPCLVAVIAIWFVQEKYSQTYQVAKPNDQIGKIV
ncbi:MFS transporter [Metabacillus sediminilitoris]|uniref:Aromatic acid/H+ symport family MFS transporter n=1 Tax=Metabacillus sediminilitoris TaxID=2567941 RepID=A0A4S4C3U7_9BACI|nr:aromatic acid/H+ symport family MFS transporter [Metabacillus sediminilitoris]QGQ45347.1 MFS transporter [Metabacillus sediminilitoris]THF82355.1 aromatic acid/H+ symport family MFS transporter [Metabacillus sediminilitoris]